VDEDALRRRFYELSRQHHPDFHQLAGEAEQAASLADSALVNRAYRALRDPIARVEYVVALEGGEASGAAKTPAPKALLMEMLEVQEALEEAKESGLDDGARERLRDERSKLVTRRAATDAAIVARGVDWDAAVDQGADRGPLLAWF
jgi:molecular chaperone HscB